MKFFIIILSFVFQNIGQQVIKQPQLKDKIWYCAKYTSLGEMKKIDRHNPVFRFGISFVNPENKSGNNYTRFNVDGVITGKWSLSQNNLTLIPDDYTSHKVETYVLIPSGDPNYMTLKDSKTGNKYYMVLGD